MIEELKNTVVKVDNEQQARCVVALYELAGFDQYGDSKFDGYVSTNDNRCFYGGVTITDDTEITIGQLAWDYGLAPDGADAIAVIEIRGEEKIFWLSNSHEEYSIAAMEFGRAAWRPMSPCKHEIISTRPQVKQETKPQWDGEGLPPVSCEVQTSTGQVIVVATKYNDVVIDDGNCIRVVCPDAVRPIKTERDEFIEKARNAAGECYGYDLDDYFHKLYDAGARFND